jgi:hypothetical protein
MQKAIKTILISGLLAGTLDCISAVAFLGKMNFSRVWKYVASGYFGNYSFAGGNEMVVYGLLFHFIIALFWAVVYYFIFTKISFFTNNLMLGGLLYGIVIWCVMNLVVLPFTNIPKSSFAIIEVLKNIPILMLSVGLPISLIMNRSNKI